MHNVLRISTDNSPNLRADCNRPELADVLLEHGAWQSAEHLKAVYQGVIPVVAIRGI
jgi:hypothetical protein